MRERRSSESNEERTSMRISYSAFVIVLGVTAAAPSAAAQVLTLFDYGYAHNLDHPVPVATVSLVGDIVELDGSRVVQDSYGEPFVLGAATLDLRVPSQPKVVFTITNRTEKPIRLQDVLVYERTMVASTYLHGVTVGAPYMPMSSAGWGPGGLEGEELQPAARLTVEAPLSPFGPKGVITPSGFVVFVGRKLPQGHKDVDPRSDAWLRDDKPVHAAVSMEPAGRAWLGENALFTRAFLALLSQAQRPESRGAR
jgi:hypothetical protein